MPSPLKGLLERLRPRQYARRHPLILLNGLAEQAESSYPNPKSCGRSSDVLTPNILASPAPPGAGRARAPRGDRGGRPVPGAPAGPPTAHLPAPVAPPPAVSRGVE